MIVTDNERNGRIASWVAKKLFSRVNSDEAIGIERDNEIVAGVTYDFWYRTSFVCHIAVEGLLTPNYLRAIFHYPFVHCGAKKIIVPVDEGNEESLRFVKKLGFREEARILDASPDGSVLLYTMTPDQCRFIGEKHGERFAFAAASA